MLHTLNGLFHIVGHIPQQLIPFLEHGFHFPGFRMYVRLQVFGQVAQFLFLRNEYPGAESGGIKKNDGGQPEHGIGVGEQTDIGQTGGDAHTSHEHGRDEKGDVTFLLSRRQESEYQGSHGEEDGAGDVVPVIPGREVIRYDLQNGKGYCTDGH